MTTAGQKSHVRHFFNRSDGWKGSFYRDVNNPFGQMLVRRKEHVLRLFRDHVDQGNASIFDAGCGPGEYLGEFAGRGYVIYGMDASEEMLRSSGETLRDSRVQGGPMLIRGDIEHIPIRPGSFDAVLCIGVLGYLERDDRALAELHRLLRPGGHLVLNVRNLNALTSIHYSSRLKLRYLHSHGWGKLRSAVSIATHARDGGWKSRAYNVGRLEKEVESAGFRRVDGLTFGYEFKALGKLGLSGRAIVKAESLFENLMLAMPFRSMRYSGWGYVGVFRKESAR
jgi:SAM-dependent methyltransferase